MRRIRTSILTLFSTALLALCVAAAVISRHRTLRWGWNTRGGRYSLVIDHARLLVRAPPTPPRVNNVDETQAWQYVKEVRNEDFQWECVWVGGPGDVAGPTSVEPVINTDLAWLPYAGASDRPFLAALDDPRKFVAAHIFLSLRHGDGHLLSGSLTLIGGAVAVDLKGMRFHLHMAPPKLAEYGGFVLPVPEGAVTVDPGQLSTIRNMWHDALDRTLLSFSIWWLTCPAVLNLAFVLAAALRCQKRLRSGRCVQCGYDLRGSRDRCPECGMASQH